MAGAVGHGATGYSALDRLVHRLAFAAPAVQLAAADIEAAAFKSGYAGVRCGPPVFVTSLPRAGTTVLLEALHRVPGFAAHTYRDMPFVMAPILWSRMSGAFRKRAAKRERAHGDGMVIDYDSPEAFEEVIWRAFWPEKYRGDRIELWGADDALDEATAFLEAHMRKIVALRRPAGGRYVSKNNANIARLDLLAAMFPEASIVVPVRAPLDHAASLLRQHENFLDRHGTDPFTERYMRDIGHYEFGALHRPLAFPGLAGRLEGRDRRTLDYWLAYYIAAAEHLLAHAEGVILVGHEALRADPRGGLDRLFARIGVEPGADTAAAAGVFRPPATRSEAPPAADPALRAEAEALHVRLMECAVV